MKFGYVLRGLVRHQIPDQWFFALGKLSGGGTLSESDVDGSFAELQKRLEGIGTDLENKHILDVGSGRYARVALRMLRAGADRVTLVDMYAVELSEHGHELALLRDCIGLGLDPGDALARIRVCRRDFVSLPAATPEEAADIVSSAAALEHACAPYSVLSKCWEWLKPGGVTSHFVDLRDHPSTLPFEMLTFSDRVWKRWLNPRGGFGLNRWRLTDYLNAMRQIGFIDVDYEVLQSDEPELRAITPRLTERFRGIDRDLLSVLLVHLHGKRPVV
jgi:SAM-dependent methyltransferase